MKKLIIVESPAKAGVIKKFLGRGTKVLASKGHLRDLPKSRLGVEIEKEFEPEYIKVRGKAPLINELIKEAKAADVVYLATDPDREGEAIAWHLAFLLGIDVNSNCRVTFNEITKEAVVNAVKNPRKIDMDLVDAQQARRVLDRIVGYKTSPLLWKKVKSGLSAGRVQSVALRIIVERENEIKAFVPEEYWNLDALLSKENIEFISKFFGKSNKKLKITSKKQVDEIISDLKNNDFVVKDYKEGTRKKNPVPPYTTSTMQQSASRNINFTIKKTMSVAQKLYEGINIPGRGHSGLITYMRTDSTRISEGARAKAKEIIESKFGKEYYESRYFKQKSNSQDGHEAIRPTYPELSPNSIKESLSADEFKLYNLIYNRFLSSQMASAVYDTIKVKFDNSGYEFRTNASKLKFDGFLRLYGVNAYAKSEAKKKEDNKASTKAKEKEDSYDEYTNFPKLKIGDIVDFVKFNKKQSFTEPPARYTEASLVKVLEEHGIGRPSTYSPTISTLQTRRYIKKEKRTLIPTDIGEIVNDILIKSFDTVFNKDFTADIEEKFDEISEGKRAWKKLLKEFYEEYAKYLVVAEKDLEKVELEVEVSDEKCKLCGKDMIYKYGRFGKFLACSNYPECKNTKGIFKTIQEKCPKCSRDIEERKSKRGAKYYICTGNPKEGCDYISWNKPGEEPKKKRKPRTKKTKAKKTTKKTTKK